MSKRSIRSYAPEEQVRLRAQLYDEEKPVFEAASAGHTNDELHVRVSVRTGAHFNHPLAVVGIRCYSVDAGMRAIQLAVKAGWLKEIRSYSFLRPDGEWEQDFIKGDNVPNSHAMDAPDGKLWQNVHGKLTVCFVGVAKGVLAASAARTVLQQQNKRHEKHEDHHP